MSVDHFPEILILIKANIFSMNSSTSRVTGPLLGGAISDALGYPVKFTNLNDIERKYGMHTGSLREKL